MTRTDTERNLLFGLLALQNDFIGRDAVVAAFGIWVADKARPLVQILLDRGDLDPDDVPALEALVRRHLKRHGDNPARSLGALSSIGSARELLEQIPDPDLHASLGHVAAGPPTEDDAYATRNVSLGPPTATGGRFRVLRFHAKGGLGKVSVARDTELNREVALKEIQDHHADEPQSRARFVLEAEVTGGLEHPGIVPVYSLYRDSTGRPYYAMRLIRGETLHDAIRRFHAADDDPRRDPGERSLSFQKLLRRFLDVCDARSPTRTTGA